MTLTQRAAVGLALALAVGLTACTKDDSALPEVAEPTSSGGSASGRPTVGADATLEDVAEAFHGCLRDAGLPAETAAGADGRLVKVTFSAAADDAVWSDADGITEWTDSVSEQTRRDFDRIATAGKPHLWADGEDRTEDYARCLAESGYSASAVAQAAKGTTLPGAEGRIQSTIDSSNRWAKCAREHGFPETKDATREVWGALLPSHIDETRLRQLLVECPVTLDEAAERRNQELTEEFYRDDPNRQGGPEGLEMAPAVKFDYPGFNGTEGLGQDDPTTQRLAKLTTIIDESHGQAQGDQPLPG